MPNVRDEPGLGRLALQPYSQRVKKKTSSPRARLFKLPYQQQNLTLIGNQMQSKAK